MNNDKVFGHYSALPTEVRLMIIDAMQPTDRCRFTRCSRSTNEQARTSKNFLYELKIIGSFDCVEIVVKHSPVYGYIVRFYEEPYGFFSLRYYNLHMVELWVDTLQCSYWINYSMQYFKNLLQIYQTTIKSLVLKGMQVENYLRSNDFELRILNHLKNLDMSLELDATTILSRIQQPLMNLSFWGEENSEVFGNAEQIYTVSNVLFLPHVKLNNPQFRRLSASTITIHIGELTIQNIVSFIRSWQQGMIRNNFQSCIWCLKNSRFNISQLFRNFRVIQRRRRAPRATILHDTNPDVTLELSHLDVQNAIELKVLHDVNAL